MPPHFTGGRRFAELEFVFVSPVIGRRLDESPVGEVPVKPNCPAGALLVRLSPRPPVRIMFEITVPDKCISPKPELPRGFMVGMSPSCFAT